MGKKVNSFKTNHCKNQTNQPHLLTQFKMEGIMNMKILITNNNMNRSSRKLLQKSRLTTEAGKPDSK